MDSCDAPTALRSNCGQWISTPWELPPRDGRHRPKRQITAGKIGRSFSLWLDAKVADADKDKIT